MMMKRLFAMAVIGALGATLTSIASADAPSSGGQYEALVKHNIFVRNRRPTVSLRTPLRPTRTELEETKLAPAPPSKPASFFVIRGLAIQGEERIAFIEDLRDQITHKVKIGDPIADGVLVEINLDDVLFECEGELKQIRIGRTLLDVPAQTAYDRPAAVAIRRTSRTRTGDQQRNGRNSQSNRDSRDSRGGADDRSELGEGSGGAAVVTHVQTLDEAHGRVSDNEAAVIEVSRQQQDDQRAEEIRQRLRDRRQRDE